MRPHIHNDHAKHRNWQCLYKSMETLSGGVRDKRRHALVPPVE